MAKKSLMDRKAADCTYGPSIMAVALLVLPVTGPCSSRKKPGRFYPARSINFPTVMMPLRSLVLYVESVPRMPVHSGC